MEGSRNVILEKLAVFDTDYEGVRVRFGSSNTIVRVSWRQLRTAVAAAPGTDRAGCCMPTGSSASVCSRALAHWTPLVAVLTACLPSPLIYNPGPPYS